VIISYMLASGKEVKTLTYGPAKDKLKPMLEPGFGLTLKFWDLLTHRLKRLDALSVVSLRDVVAP